MQNHSLTKAGLTGLSGAVATFTTAAALIVSILGKAFTKAAVAGGAAPTVDGVTGAPITLKANQGTVVLWVLDDTSTIKCVQGSVETVNAAGNFIYAPQFPTLPDNMTAFAYSVHKADSTAAAWTFGVSNWNAAGLTHTATDLIFVPNRPQIA